MAKSASVWNAVQKALRFPSGRAVVHLPIPEPVQLQLAANPKFALLLAFNPHLSEKAWISIWKRFQFDQLTTSILCARTLSEHQRDLVFTAGDLGEYPLMVALDVHDDADMVSRAIEAGLSGRSPYAAAWALSRIEPADPRFPLLVANLGMAARFEWLTHQSDISDEELLCLFASAGEVDDVESNHQGVHSLGTSLAFFINTRPHLVSQMAAPEMPLFVHRAVAACRHLVDPAAQWAMLGLDPNAPPPKGWRLDVWLGTSMAANPTTNIELVGALSQCSEPQVAGAANSRLSNRGPAVTVPYEEVEDDEAYAWLLSRVTGAYAAKASRPWDLLALVASPRAQRAPGARMTNLIDIGVIRDLVGRTALASAMEDLRVQPATEYDRTPFWVRAPASPWSRQVTDAISQLPYRYDFEDPAEVGSQLVDWEFSYRLSAAGLLVIDALGDDPTAWSTFLALADTARVPLSEVLSASVNLHVS